MKSQTRLSDFTFSFHSHALEKEMATHSRALAWRIPGTGEPSGLPSMESHRVRHDWSDWAAAAAAAAAAAVSLWGGEILFGLLHKVAGFPLHLGEQRWGFYNWIIQPPEMQSLCFLRPIWSHSSLFPYDFLTFSVFIIAVWERELGHERRTKDYAEQSWNY